MPRRRPLPCSHPGIQHPASFYSFMLRLLGRPGLPAAVRAVFVPTTLDTMLAQTTQRVLAAQGRTMVTVPRMAARSARALASGMGAREAAPRSHFAMLQLTGACGAPFQMSLMSCVRSDLSSVRRPLHASGRHPRDRGGRH